MPRRTLDVLRRALLGREQATETLVHFHQGPEGRPAACYDARCASPHLDVRD